MYQAKCLCYYSLFCLQFKIVEFYNLLDAILFYMMTIDGTNVHNKDKGVVFGVSQMKGTHVDFFTSDNIFL